VCARRPPTGRILPVNVVFKVSGNHVQMEAAPGFHRSCLETGALSSPKDRCLFNVQLRKGVSLAGAGSTTSKPVPQVAELVSQAAIGSRDPEGQRPRD
jgi:hypothetical protein